MTYNIVQERCLVRPVIRQVYVYVAYVIFICTAPGIYVRTTALPEAREATGIKHYKCSLMYVTHLSRTVWDLVCTTSVAHSQENKNEATQNHMHCVYAYTGYITVVSKTINLRRTTRI